MTLARRKKDSSRLRSSPSSASSSTPIQPSRRQCKAAVTRMRTPPAEITSSRRNLSARYPTGRADMRDARPDTASTSPTGPFLPLPRRLRKAAITVPDQSESAKPYTVESRRHSHTLWFSLERGEDLPRHVIHRGKTMFFPSSLQILLLSLASSFVSSGEVCGRSGSLSWVLVAPACSSPSPSPSPYAIGSLILRKNMLEEAKRKPASGRLKNDALFLSGITTKENS